MEEGKGSSSSAAAASSSRWNPTREQIAILEGLYRQGVRTPSAEQIQQITGKLQEYGPIEGKNVFYWFQNHKARQRQKQKQESFAYFSRLLHQGPTPNMTQQPPPVLAPPPNCGDVVCRPYYIPIPQAGGAGFFQPHFPTVLLAGAVKRSLRPELQRMEHSQDVYNNPPPHPSYQNNHSNGIGSGDVGETLQLFPLHPTGILEERSGSTLTSASAETVSTEEGEDEVGVENQPLFNFFGGNN